MPVLKREEVIAELQRALVEPVYRGTPDHDRLADMARVFGIQVERVKPSFPGLPGTKSASKSSKLFTRRMKMQEVQGGSLVQE